MRACFPMLNRRSGLRSGDAKPPPPPPSGAAKAAAAVVASHRGPATVAVPPPATPAPPPPEPAPKAAPKAAPEPTAESEQVTYVRAMRPHLFDEASLAQTHAFKAEVCALDAHCAVASRPRKCSLR